MAQMDKRILKSIEKLDSASLSKLLSSGVSTQGVDKKGNTFLHLAAISNSIELCGILIAGGCDPLCRNKNGMTASEVADKKKKKKTATYLKEQEIKFATNLKSSTNTQPSGAPPTQQPNTPKSQGETNPYPNLKSTSATVNIFCYDYNIQDWQQVLSEATLTVEFTPNPFGFQLIASNGSATTISDPISADTVFSKSTDSFYNYRLGEGEVYGFQFIDHLDEFCTAITDAKYYTENPPVPVEPIPEVIAEPIPVPPAPAAPQAGVAAPAPPAPPAPPSGGVPPAPPAPPAPGGPPPPPPPPVPVPAAGGGKALSLAEQLALKKQKLNETGGATDPAQPSGGGAPAAASAPAPAASSGGGMMSELQLRLQKRQSVGAQPKLDHSQPTESAPAQPATAPASEAAPLSRTISGSFKPSANPLKSSAVPPAQKKVNPPNATPSAPEAVVASGDKQSSGYSKQDLEVFKNAMIEGFKAELQQIKEDIIYSIRQEISTYVN